MKGISWTQATFTSDLTQLSNLFLSLGVSNANSHRTIWSPSIPNTKDRYDGSLSIDSYRQRQNRSLLANSTCFTFSTVRNNSFPYSVIDLQLDGDQKVVVHVECLQYHSILPSNLNLLLVAFPHLSRELRI